jgi:hypothetical protein
MVYFELEGANPALKRASSELFTKDEIPAVSVSLVS